MLDFEHLDHYELLGVSRTAAFDEIKRAYRREISKYHPDRFVNASPEEQAYASQRSQRITEAYSLLSDFAARNAYNRGQTADVGARRSRPDAVAHQRDHQAELYDQAIMHLNAGRLLQAIGLLRQLQQINPFYRNSAELLAQAEAQLNQRSDRTPRNFRPLFITAGTVAGIVVGMVAIAAIAWSLGIGRNILARRLPTSAPNVAAAAAPTAAPEPAATTPEPTSAPTVAPTAPPTSEPTAAPTAAPTTAPTAAPTTVPSATPTAAPIVAPASPSAGGQLILADAFDTDSWATLQGPGWQVGYQGQRYRVHAEPGSGAIWSYRNLAQQNVVLSLDVQMGSGEGGLLVRLLDAKNYLAVVLNPSQTSYRVEQRRGGALSVLAGGQSEAILSAPESANRLMVRLNGAALQVYANGQLLADVVANNPPETGRYGLLAIGRDADAEVFFDNLEIRTIE